MGSYANVLSSCFDEKETTAVISRLEVVPGKGWVPNRALSQQKNRIIAAEAIERSNEQAKKGKYDEGRQELEEAIQKITKGLSKLNTEDEAEAALQDLISDLNECKESMVDANIFHGQGKYTLANKGQSHWFQRSNDVWPIFSLHQCSVLMLEDIAPKRKLKCYLK